MTVAAAFANASWLAASLPEWRRFRRATSKLEETQRNMLAGYIARGANSGFGREHGFSRISSWEDYAAAVPIRAYDELEPWIERIKAGTPQVLTEDRVVLLEPSSGSTGPEKLVPYTRTLQSEFRRGVATWIAQLFLGNPQLMGGRAYWSLTPHINRERTIGGEVPVGFDEDSAYLGGIAKRLIDMTLATRPALRRIDSMNTFWYATLLLLLKCKDLRLMSVWHPSYIEILLKQLARRWPELLRDLHDGMTIAEPYLHIGADRARASELETIGAGNPGRIWPKLGLISCWGDAQAAVYIDDVRAAFPAARIQPKGLVATEAFVTLPLGADRPLAIRSHFFEFADGDGRVHPAWDIEPGQPYTLVVTTGGGLYRYRLGDRVQVTGYVGETPSLEFLGKDDNVSDYFGEKLSEPFVTSALKAVFDRFELSPKFAMIALDDSAHTPCYTLFIQCDDELPGQLAQALEAELGRNPHYDLCIRLGQLKPVQTGPVAGDAYEIFSKRMMDSGIRLGDIKPIALSRLTDWSRYFTGS